MSFDTDLPLKLNSVTIADGDKSKSVTEQAKDLVDKLYAFKDKYFENKEINEQSANQKIIDVQEKLEKTLNKLNSFEWDRKEKADYHLFIGKTLNVVPKYDSQCQENLSKAIKLNPRLSEAWYQLGECHWKKNDIDGAYNCFKSALEYQSDKHILRAMSMAVRQLPSKTPLENSQKFTESIEKAKAALKLDITDGNSWGVLGNAYLNSFFSFPFNAKVMTLALAAYQRALKDPIANGDADLHYNYGIALQYESNFEDSLRQLCLAACLDPTWRYPKESICRALTFVDKLQISIDTRGKMKEKRFRQLVTSLREPRTRTRDLGPYVDNHNLTVVTFADLKEGTNRDMAVLCRVVCGVEVNDGNGGGGQLAYTVVVVDEASALMALRVFNLGAGKGPVMGDGVLVPEPFVERVIVTVETVSLCLQATACKDDAVPMAPGTVNTRLLQTGAEIPTIRVPVPSILVVNGRKIRNDQWTALPQVHNLFFPENWLSST